MAFFKDNGRFADLRRTALWPRADATAPTDAPAGTDALAAIGALERAAAGLEACGHGNHYTRRIVECARAFVADFGDTARPTKRLCALMARAAV